MKKICFSDFIFMSLREQHTEKLDQKSEKKFLELAGLNRTVIMFIKTYCKF